MFLSHSYSYCAILTMFVNHNTQSSVIILGELSMLAMERFTTSSSTESAREFIEAWDAHYEHGVSEIRLFDPSATQTLDFTARHYLIKALYHARSGLADLLIQMAYHAPDRRMKDKAMENIALSKSRRALI